MPAGQNFSLSLPSVASLRQSANNAAAQFNSRIREVNEAYGQQLPLIRSSGGDIDRNSLDAFRFAQSRAFDASPYGAPVRDALVDMGTVVGGLQFADTRLDAASPETRRFADGDPRDPRENTTGIPGTISTALRNGANIGLESARRGLSDLGRTLSGASD